MKPVIAIVGRQNVGKSTLFNRIVGSRKAITYGTPGVTRDRHFGEASWTGRDFLVIDTGGFPFDPAGTLEKKVRSQIDLAIREADLILFVLDGKGGLLPEEKEIARSLRRKAKKTLFVVNKIDQTSHEDRLADFYALGGDLFPVSAEHGNRVGDLLDAVVKDLPKGGGEGVSDEIRVALIGRPNVGKSSLLNSLLGQERVIVDERPGTTRDVIDTPCEVGGRRFRLLDTAGIQKRGRWGPGPERVAALMAIEAARRADVCLLLLDAVQGITNQDAHVGSYPFEARRGVLVVWNKWDLVQKKKGEEERYRREVARRLGFLSYAPVLSVSAKTGWGTEAIWDHVTSLYELLGRRVKTSELNQVLQDLVTAHGCPSDGGRPIRFYYATQVKTFPPTFSIFVNRPQGIHFSFRRYLLNGFREALRFDGVPLGVVFRESSRRGAHGG